MLESDSLREECEERAAIMEFDGQLTREDAERAAMAEFDGRLPRQHAEALAFAGCVAEGLSHAAAVTVVASLGAASPVGYPHDAGVQARRQVFARQLDTAPAGVLVPRFVFREAPYVKGHCHACGEALERVRWGSCWRCSVARRLVCGAPVPIALFTAYDGNVQPV
ncbi:MAG: hypothetical protein O2973_13905 [Gemmatimonadetes bacterium]|nr:hypothetical protein [Gemmatimonadota bacterium]